MPHDTCACRSDAGYLRGVCGVCWKGFDSQVSILGSGKLSELCHSAVQSAFRPGNEGDMCSSADELLCQGKADAC